MSTTTIRKILGARALHSVTPETRLRDVAKMLAEHRIGAVVVTEGGALKGVLSERDLVYRGVVEGLDFDEARASDVMTADPVTVDIDAGLPETLSAHLGTAFRHMPVTEEGRVVGLLSYRDVPAEYIMLYERFQEMVGARADD